MTWDVNLFFSQVWEILFRERKREGKRERERQRETEKEREREREREKERDRERERNRERERDRERETERDRERDGFFQLRVCVLCVRIIVLHKKCFFQEKQKWKEKQFWLFYLQQFFKWLSSAVQKVTLW